MNWTKKFAQEHIYIFSFTTTIIAITLLYISFSWLFKADISKYDLNRILIYLVPFIFIFGVSLVLSIIKKYTFYKEGIIIGFILGWPFITVGVYNFVFSYVSFSNSDFPFPSLETIFFYTFTMLLIGIFEEVLCRGIILNNMLKKWGDTKSGIIKAVILSSVIFGIGHIINLIVSPTLVIRTLSQVIYTSLHAILYASIYLRTKNIWVVIILHGVFDWLLLISSILEPKHSVTTPVDISIASGLITLMYALPFALVGFFLLRKVSTNDIKSM